MTHWTCSQCFGIFLDTQDCPNCTNPKVLETSELRLYCLMRMDLEIPLGKMLAQAGHAFVSTLYCAMSINNKAVDHYMQNAQPKITLKAKNLNVLIRAKKECDNLGLPNYLVTDAGRTVFSEPTVTCLGIGPVMKSQLSKYIQGLQLL